MKDRERKRMPFYRPFLVSWNEARCIKHMTKSEMEEKLLTGEVNQISCQGTLDPFELFVYIAKLRIEHDALEEDGRHITANNKAIATTISTEEQKISRNAVARARRRVKHKLGFKAGW